MPLLIVPLAASDTELLTLGEWAALEAKRLVLFEDAGHPLRPRLDEAGVRTSPVETEPDPGDDGSALVADPLSERIAALAARGAEVSTGGIEVPDALTAVRGAYLFRRAEKSLGTLAFVMARLRGPDGCPWDAKQTHDSLLPHLIEEAEEVAEAINEGTHGGELEEELGDVLLQVAFHAQLGADEGRFDFATIADVLVAKLIRRHPHVFGDVSVADADEVVRNWNRIKQEEKDGSAS
jgi:XTP/dITP diphosphohydrolase